MADQGSQDDEDSEARRVERLVRISERLARAAGVSRDQYMADVVAGRRPPINADDVEPADGQPN